jgi:hypothetical protein
LLITSPTSVSPRDDNHRNAAWLLSLRTKFPRGSRRIRRRIPQSCCKRKTERNCCATPCAAVTEARRGHRPRLLPQQIGHGDRGDRRHRRGRSSLARRPLLKALPRRAVYGGANGVIFFLFFFLGLLLFHSLISMPPHFFEVIGFRLTRFPR